MIKLTPEQRKIADLIDSKYREFGVADEDFPRGGSYDRDGQRITPGERHALKIDPDYSRIAETTTPDGRFWISTVWLGWNHGRGSKLQIFETMVFGEPQGDAQIQTRYGTELEARQGHALIVERMKTEGHKIN